MSCDFAEKVSLLIDERLSGQEAQEVRLHLKTCADCRNTLEDFLYLRREIKAYPAQADPVTQRAALNKILASGQARSRKKWASLPAFRYAAVGAAILFITLAALLWRYTQRPRPSWEVMRLAGAPAIESNRIGKTGRLQTGQWLETDSASRALLQVGAIGQVEVETSTRVRLLAARTDENRLALERGRIYATILAPPRLFFVETPSAVAIDLGCAYSLDVDDKGASFLRVDAGWVALAFNGRESLVPAGAICRTKPGIGPGTPYLEDASEKFRAALAKFDFERGGAEALAVVLAEARPRDGLSLWHLLERVEGDRRVEVYERLASLVPPPADVGREKALALDRNALAPWREKIEYVSVGIDPNAVPQASGTLRPTGVMNNPRFAHTATLLTDGRVLVTGGQSNWQTALASAELYDPATGAFTETGSMTVYRVGHTATLLRDGRVLITGGSPRTFFSGAYSNAEIYDPATGTFAPTGSMATDRLAHRATLLPDGRVLITGGQEKNESKLASAELYDPATGAFTPIGNMNSPRSDHTATLLNDGKVLLAGGAFDQTSYEAVGATAELFDPATGRFTPTGNLSAARYKHSAVLLPDGRVMLIGGSDSRMWRGRYASAEIYDPATGVFTATAAMRTARYKIRDAVALLKNGQALVAGGGARVEVYDPATNLFSAAPGAVGAARHYATATLLANGDVLILGGYSNGYNAGNSANASAWIYQPE